MERKLISPVGWARIATGVLGIIILGLGLHSHFKSSWTKYANVKPHEIICKLPLDGKKCPNILMEYYFIGVIILTFLGSMIGMVSAYMVDFSKKPYKHVDFACHVVALFLLLSAAVVYIVSAEQINNLNEIFPKEENFKLLRVEKLVAAALTLLQSLLYGVVAFLILKQD